MARAAAPRKRARKAASDASEAEDALSDSPAGLDSDALDESDDGAAAKTKKRKRTAAPRKSASPKKSRKKKKKQESDEEDEDEDDGRVVVGTVIQAPKTGRVSPGQISKNTFDFLTQLKNPDCNDREWFKLHEPVYRLAETEWKAFIEAFNTALVDADPQIPILPPKDVIHRIYRDIRFSNDKTPYKTGFSASFSRSGRMNKFAGYFIMIKPGGESMLAAGTWCPGKNEIATIRSHILRNPRRLRRVIAEPEFVRFFGTPKPHPKGARQNIFGQDDELKVAPKGVDKTHKDIDLLKCRSFAVSHKFLDSEVLAPDFKDRICDVVRVLRPFVHLLNDMMTLPASDDEDDEEEEDDANGEDEDNANGEEEDNEAGEEE